MAIQTPKPERESMLDRFTILADGLDHPEGVAWNPVNGRVCAGGEGGQIYEIDLDGEMREIGATGGFVLGVTVDGAGRVYAFDLARHQVLRIDDGAVSVYSAGTEADPMRTPNYGAFAEDGTLYVTDSGGWQDDDGLVYRLAPGGGATVWTRALNRFPNGCCLSVDADALFVVESTLPGVVRVPIEADGSAGAPELVVELPGTVPDGVALDIDGNLYIACYRPDRIYRCSPEGRELEVYAEDPLGVLLSVPTNVAFVGTDGDRIVAASLGRWHLAIADAGVRGAPLRYPIPA